MCGVADEGDTGSGVGGGVAEAEAEGSYGVFLDGGDEVGDLTFGFCGGGRVDGVSPLEFGELVGGEGEHII